MQQLRADIEEFVTGALERRRRMEEADAWIGQSRMVDKQLARAHIQRMQLARRLINEPKLTGSETLVKKRRRWHLERELELLDLEVSEAEVVLESHLSRAIQQVPDHPEVRLNLTEFYRSQFKKCRELEDRWGARRHLESLRRFCGAGDAYLSDTVELSIQIEDLQADVYLCQLEEEDHIDTGPSALLRVDSVHGGNRSRLSPHSIGIQLQPDSQCIHFSLGR